MGTYGRVTLVTHEPAAAATLAESAFGVFRHVDRTMSNWTETSEVARINREAGSRATAISADVATVIAEALRVWALSDGAFDITLEPLVRAWGFLGGSRRVPTAAEAAAAFARVGSERIRLDRSAGTIAFTDPATRIDLGGIAKGFAVDRAAETLAARGVRDALVDLTGNMRAIGTPADAPAWRIGIRDPHDRMTHFARLHIPAGHGISTSASYEQFILHDGKPYGHLLDPRTGKPAEGFSSVTIVAPTALEAEGWSTALFVLGPRDAKRLAPSAQGVAFICVEPRLDGPDRVWVSAALRERFALVPQALELFEIDWVE
jgi:thiamine biosynthesis lipoprotein